MYYLMTAVGTVAKGRLIMGHWPIRNCIFFFFETRYYVLSLWGKRWYYYHKMKMHDIACKPQGWPLASLSLAQWEAMGTPWLSSNSLPNMCLGHSIFFVPLDLKTNELHHTDTFASQVPDRIFQGSFSMEPKAGGSEKPAIYFCRHFCRE